MDSSYGTDHLDTQSEKCEGCANIFQCPVGQAIISKYLIVCEALKKGANPVKVDIDIAEDPETQILLEQANDCNGSTPLALPELLVQNE